MRTKMTLYDVAHFAGVSKSTVSRALNNHRGINEETRQRVLDTCKQLGYYRNSSARALKTGKTNRIIVLIENIRAPWAAEMVAGINSTAVTNDYEPILMLNESVTAGGLQTQIVNNGIEGIIYVAGHYVRTIDLPTEEWGIPAVSAYSVCPSIPSVIPDDKYGGYIATKSLVDRGHKNIAVIMGPESWQPSLDRVSGFKEAAIKWREEFISFGEWTYNGNNPHSPQHCIC